MNIAKKGSVFPEFANFRVIFNDFPVFPNISLFGFNDYFCSPNKI